MANEKDFKYDPEDEENVKNTKLPFGLCKSYGIQIQNRLTPKDAWEALRNGGYVNDVSEEYAEYYRKLKVESPKKSHERQKKKAKQLKNSAHNPDYNYKHEDGKIAGVKKGELMSFEQADSGNVNPFISKRTNSQIRR